MRQRWIAGALVISAGFAFAGCLPATTGVRVRNTGAHNLSVVGCIEPDSTVAPGTTVALRIPSVRPEWCAVDDSNGRYLGCLPINIDMHATVDIRAALVASPEDRCDHGVVSDSL
jgi:hypothetical protein